MANYANQCIATRQDSFTKRWFITIKFQMGLFTLECMHFMALCRQKLYRSLGYGNTGGLESIMDRQLGKTFQKVFNTGDTGMEINFG